MLAVLFVAAMMMQCSCTASKINKATRTSEDTSATETKEKENKKSTLFDRSQITQEDYSLKLIPIDPTKDIGHSTNPDTGEQQWRNAIPYYEKRTTNTNKDVTTETEEARTKDTNQESKATTDEKALDKIKFSVPWYAFLILGFFAFATIVVLFLIYKFSKTLSPLTATVADLSNRLKTLEQ